jgi:selenocysteine lyase/cysteine desulfurase
VTFNVLTLAGQVVDYRQVEAQANARRISLRTGCFCNPGAREVALGWSAAELAPLFRTGQRLTLYDLHDRWPERPVGAVRVSVGIATTPADIAYLLSFLQALAD